MESLNDLNNQQEDNAVSRTGIQLSSFQDEHQTMETETPIVPGSVHPVPQPQCQKDIVVINVEPPISVSAGLTEPLIPPVDQQGDGNCLENFILGSNKSNPIWKLRLLCALCLAFATLCILFYPDRPSADVYSKEKFILLLSVPIIVALMTLVASFACNLDEEKVTGLSVTNASMFVGVAGSFIALRQK